MTGYDLNLSQRTFQRYIKEIGDLFDIEISYDKRQNVYYIAENGSSGQRSMRLLESYETLDILHSAGNYSSYVFFENRKPGGLEHFRLLLRAAQTHAVLSFAYNKFYEDKTDNRIAYPLALKEARGRWYLIAIDTKDQKIKTFGLDRIAYPEITSGKFKPGNIPDVQELFKNFFGIVNPPRSASRKVRLSFTFHQGQYVKAYPLHESQRVVSEDKPGDEIIVELHICITYDFMMELLSFGEEVEVLSPRSLRSDIIKTYQQALKMYE